MPRLLCERAALRRLFACTTALSLIVPAIASAGDLVFSGPGNDWFDPANWLGAAVPGAADSATVTGGAQALVFAREAVANGLTIRDGALFVRDPLATQSAVIGPAAGFSGAVTVSGSLGAWQNAGALVIGGGGTGTAEIIEGATLSTGTLRLGDLTGATGLLTLRGDGSRLDVAGLLDVGHAGSGAVTVSAGAWLASGGARAGVLAGANGSLTVDRQGATLGSGSLVLGVAGTGSLLVTAGGLVEIDGAAAVAAQAGSAGSLTVDGAGSLFSAQELTLGEGGAGTLSVTAGGVVSLSGSAVLGALSGATGAAQVRGAASRLDIAGMLTVGTAGTGTLTLAESGVASSLDARIGAEAGGAGAVEMSGLDTRWTVTGHLDIGSGTLDLVAAATLATGTATVGAPAGATAEATLAGGGTQWTNDGALSVGDAGAGVLSIITGATVETAGASAGNAAGGTGAIRVDGGGSLLAVEGGFDIGRMGGGTLTVTAGATATAGSLAIGTQAGGSGIVRVDGEGSRLSVAGAFDVGRFGQGSLTVSGGATVSAGSVVIAREAGSTGTLSIGAEETALAAGAGALDTASIHFGAGAGTLVFNHGESDYRLSAAISGAGTVKAVRGTTILTGDNSYDGQTAISAGATLAVGNGGLDGTLGSGDVSNDGTLIFDRAGEIAFAGDISGTGALVKTGEGRLTLSGESRYSGATTVAAGRLDVEGALVSGVSVESGASLGGAGRIGGATVNAGGTLAAEGLAVAGDLTLSAGSTLFAGIGLNGIASVAVDGAAVIDAASVSIDYQPGGALSNRYTLIDAASVSGGFGSVSVSGLSARFSAAQALDGTTAGVGLVYDGASAVLAGTGAQGVNAALGNAFNAGATLTGPLAAALASDGAALQEAMTALSGEAGVSAGIMGLEALDGFLEAARGAGASADASTLWARMTGSGTAFEARAGQGVSAAKTALAGVEGGARIDFDAAWSGGLAMSLGRAHYDAGAGGASAEGTYGQAALHAAGRFAGGTYLSAALGAGVIDADTRRSVGGERLEGDFTGLAGGLTLEAGRRLALGELAVTPFAGASLLYGHAPAYGERGLGTDAVSALSYGRLDRWRTTLRTGVELDHETELDGRALTFSARLAYLHRFAGGGAASAAFIALPGSFFDLESLTREGGAISASAGAALALGPLADLRLDLGGEWGAGDRSLTGRLGFDLRW